MIGNQASLRAQDERRYSLSCLTTQASYGVSWRKLWKVEKQYSPGIPREIQGVDGRDGIRAGKNSPFTKRPLLSTYNDVEMVKFGA